MGRDPLLPKFIIGGATAAGTSFLSDILSQHPAVYLPPDNGTEPHFFSLTHRYHWGLDWYKRWFELGQGRHMIGDRSSSYLHFPEAVKRIKTLIPDVKLIFLLRNPVDRAWAHYRYMVFRGIETLTFEEAIEKEEERKLEESKQEIQLRHCDYTYRSLYGLSLKEYADEFPLDQLLFIDSKRLKTDLKAQIRRITDFLGIQPDFPFHLPSDFPSLSVKDPMIQYEFRQYFGITNSRITLEKIRHGAKDFSDHVKNNVDQAQLERVINNILPFKKNICLRMNKQLEDYFSYDQKIFFSLAGNSIDFKPWYDIYR